MNFDFLKKIKISLKSGPSLPSKPFSESGIRPMFIWKLLLAIYAVLILFFIFFTIFMYNFLTKTREGIVDTSLISSPKINMKKIDKINQFFTDRSEIVIKAYEKTIVDPGVN